MLTREATLKEAIDFLELNAYEGSDAITTLRMGDIEEILKPIRKLVNEHFNPQPYKFEDLKVGMWMWDDEERECRKILETYVTGEDNDVYVKGVRIVRHGLHEFNWKYSIFKEGRFFPVTKALEYQK